MRRANGTGSVVKLSGNRRKPYVAKLSAKDKYGIYRQIVLGYYEKARDAQAALDGYNKKLMGTPSLTADSLSTTFGDIYDLWSARKYQKAGKASVTSYRASWARLSALSGVKMREVSIDHLQGIIDQDEAAGLSKSSINNDKILMKALFRYALERDIVSKDYSDFVQLPGVGPKHEKGAFNDLQMKKLEQLAADCYPWADTVLMLCYTGFRITEFLTLTRFSYDVTGNYLRGGIKTDAGRNRIVPVHPKIKPYLLRWLDKGGDTIICRDNGSSISSSYYRDAIFGSIADALGVPQATPHWCRHTFATMMHDAGAPELETKRIMGHANKDVTEDYTHTDIQRLTSAILLLA